MHKYIIHDFIIVLTLYILLVCFLNFMDQSVVLDQVKLPKFISFTYFIVYFSNMYIHLIYFSDHIPKYDFQELY